MGMNRAQRCDGHKRHQSEGGLGCIIMRTTCGHFGTSVCRTKRDSSVAVDLVASMLRFTLYAPLVVCGASLPTSMTAVQASGTPCSGPDWSCLTVNTNVPSPMDNEALIQVSSSSSVNPIDMDGVEPVCVGDQVWGVGKGAYAEYAVVSCSQMSLKPLSLSFMPSGRFQKIGTPLVSSSSVAIVSGQGGTGSHGSPPSLRQM